MKKLNDSVLAQVSGARTLSLDSMAASFPEVRWADFSPDIRFDSGTPYQNPFDLSQCFKALANGQSYYYDLLSENGTYVLEVEVSFGHAPLKNSHDVEFHMGASVPAKS